MVRSKHQQRNQYQRRKCAGWRGDWDGDTGAFLRTVRMLFQSVVPTGKTTADNKPLFAHRTFKASRGV